MTMKKAVSFSTVSIRSYDITVGDSPSVSSGLPISLDWKFVEEPRVMLDEFEQNHKSRRHRFDLKLSAAQRHHKLMNSGCTGRQLVQKRLHSRPLLHRGSRPSVMATSSSCMYGNVTIAAEEDPYINTDVFVPSPSKNYRRKYRRRCSMVPIACTASDAAASGLLSSSTNVV
jgi:hypothetical protein